ncbi:hypothetical protein COJ46_04910 [Bacillus sp. AFS077874]|uniref:hypothetical protein n=1 Tax=unclassified Bacillus (in: firmicutes) TaxID=185979 RepID=UPI000BEC3990|nr:MULTISPECIES: hypothetical protein [unclassified Bacillus (in: firmicutes)]PEC49664.1 hypothetical protein CON00_07275 [Bacillus sp. AFS096315]PFM83131.1 hypothetical protein COJ46_04910 [Bacillus sp. AFS077874]
MAIIFPAVWLGITLPILLSLVFGLLKPIVTADNTGISMIIIALLIALLDGYIGIKIFNKIQLRFEKLKR